MKTFENPPLCLAKYNIVREEGGLPEKVFVCGILVGSDSCNTLLNYPAIDKDTNNTPPIPKAISSQTVVYLETIFRLEPLSKRYQHPIDLSNFL